MIQPTAVSGEMTDTNILIYAFDPDSGPRHGIARDLNNDLLLNGSLQLSVQILNEFYWNATRPNRGPSLSHDAATTIVRDLATGSRVLPLTTDGTLQALVGVAAHGLAFWDALLWAVARENGVMTIYSEDFQHGQTIEGVRFVNPFIDPATPAAP